MAEEGENKMNIATARTLGQVETEIFAGRMDVDQGVYYLIANCAVDGDDLDHIRERLRATAQEVAERPLP